MTSWGRRKDNKQAYPKTGSKGVTGAGTDTSPVSDVHMKSTSMQKTKLISYTDLEGKTHHSHPNSTVTQTILLSRDEFTEAEAKKWLKENGKIADLDIKENTFRARQVSPSKFDPDSFRTIYIGKGKEIVVGKLKKNQ